MKYKKILLSMLLLVFGSMIIFNCSNNKTKYFTVEGVKLAVGVNGTKQSEFPTMGDYSVSVNCSGVTGSWNYGNWELELSNMTSNNATCDVNFTSTTSSYTKLNAKIISLSGTTQGIGQVVNENGYRYEGKNPNNYVLFNNELWKIIGVFDSNTHGQSGQNLTKIIRNDSIGSYTWNKSNTNDWSTSSLNTILNTYYYNSQNGTGQTSCYFYNDIIPANCDFRESGLNPVARSMIQSVIWKLGGKSDENGTAAAFYSAERGTTVYSGRSTTYTGYIGLMYPSDYGYSVLSSSCTRTTNLGDYGKSACGGQSWLLKESSEGTLTPYSSSDKKVFLIDYQANLNDINGAFDTRKIRPVVYLKSSVVVLSGTGSASDPYIIRG